MRRILLDEMVPIKLRHDLLGDVKTIQFVGWTGTRNGQLLEKASGEFEAILTFDKGFAHEQNLERFGWRCAHRL